MRPLPSRLVCAGCGLAPPLEDPYPFRCAAAREGDDVDHVVRRELQTAALSPEAAREVFLSRSRNPFVRYRRLSHAYLLARSQGVSDASWVATVRRLDGRVAAIAGRGFRVTPCKRSARLGSALGFARRGGVWVKDETGNVTGSHKGRHFMGLGLWLETVRLMGLDPSPEADERELQVASCGNAALAAAVLARALDRRLRVFVPPDARRRVTRRLERLGASVTSCPRHERDAGDPCFAALRRGLRGAGLPFTCQGSENGLVIEGGETLAWEIVSTLLRRDRRLDHLIVQVGGGALASACVQGLSEARDLGLLERLPRVHAVQTRGAAPLRRAWRRLAARLAAAPGSAPEEEEVADASPDGDLELARRAAARATPAAITETVRWAARHRSACMWPWESAPRSIARGILDDETYDWLRVVEGMLRSGGLPLVVSERRLKEARHLGREVTEVPVDATGAAGLAGLLDLRRRGLVRPEETVAVLFTGVSRSPLSRRPDA